MENVISEAVLLKFKEKIVADYARMYGGDLSDHRVKDFANSIKFELGKKYIRVVQNGSAHSFIVATDTDNLFPYGTLLKSASWKAPAKNFRRGNIFTDLSRVRWTGVA